MIVCLLLLKIKRKEKNKMFKVICRVTVFVEADSVEEAKEAVLEDDYIMSDQEIQSVSRITSEEFSQYFGGLDE